MNTKIYAWANPVSPKSIVGFVDHTWVTNYPFTNGQYETIANIPPGGKYWYCWGKYHKSAIGGIDKNPNGAIGSQDGDLNMATKLVSPNLAPPHLPGNDYDPQGGSIFYYAVDGVCHTVANQALFSTGINGQEPLRVVEADGYHISSFLYSDYGLNKKVWNATAIKYAPYVKTPSDNFTGHLESMGFAPNEVTAIKAIRTNAQQKLTELHPKVETMNTLEVYGIVAHTIFHAFKEIKKHIGEGNFLKLFPSLHKFPKNIDEAGFWINQEQLAYSMENIARINAM